MYSSSAAEMHHGRRRGVTGYTRNKSSASGTRFLRPTEGNSTRWPSRQLPLLGFNSVGHSLLKGSTWDMAACLDRKTTAAGRECSERLRFHGSIRLHTDVHPQPREWQFTTPAELTRVLPTSRSRSLVSCLRSPSGTRGFTFPLLLSIFS